MSVKACHFEDYQVGQKGIANLSFCSRTVTEADIVNFAGITADFSRGHMDRHYFANSIYGGRVAHGLLGSSLVTGELSLSAPHLLGRGNQGAYFYSFDVNYRDAIKVGDTIHVKWQVAEKTDSTYEGFGLVKSAFQVLNQEEKPIYDGTIGTLVRKESAKNADLRAKPAEPWQVTEYLPNPDKIYYSEDDPVGKGGDTDGRTITETDIVNFAGLTGDYDPQYVDAEFAKSSIFKQRIAHGMLTFTITYGLWMRHWHRYHRPESRVAGHLWDNVTFLAPVKIGDTIHCRYKVAATRVSKTKPEVGLVTYGLQTINQRGEVVQEASTINMIESREGLRMQGAI